MTARLSGFLSGAVKDGDVSSAIREYESRYAGMDRGTLDLRKAEYLNFVKLYFDLVTDFYEYGWNRSFHFAARARKESFEASLARHEHYLAHMPPASTRNEGTRPGLRYRWATARDRAFYRSSDRGCQHQRVPA